MGPGAVWSSGGGARTAAGWELLAPGEESLAHFVGQSGPIPASLLRRWGVSGGVLWRPSTESRGGYPLGDGR